MGKFLKLKTSFNRFLVARFVSPLRFRFGSIVETKGTTEFHSILTNYFSVFVVE